MKINPVIYLFLLYCFAMLFTAKNLVSIAQAKWGDLMVDVPIAIILWIGCWLTFESICGDDNAPD